MMVCVCLCVVKGDVYGTGYVAFLLVEDRAVGDQINVLYVIRGFMCIIMSVELFMVALLRSDFVGDGPGCSK